MLQAISTPLLTLQAKASEVVQGVRALVKDLEAIDNGPLDGFSDAAGLIELKEGKERLNASFSSDKQYPNFDVTIKRKSDEGETISRFTVNDTDVQGIELKRQGGSISGNSFFTDESGFIVSAPIKENKAKLWWATSSYDLNVV